MGQETILLTPVHQSVPMKPVDIPRPSKFGFIQPGPKKWTKKMININDNHEIKNTNEKFVRFFSGGYLGGFVQQLRLSGTRLAQVPFSLAPFRPAIRFLSVFVSS